MESVALDCRRAFPQPGRVEDRSARQGPTGCGLRGRSPALGATPGLTGVSPQCEGGPGTGDFYPIWGCVLSGGVIPAGGWGLGGGGSPGGRGLGLTVPHPDSQAHRGPHGPRGGWGRLGVAGRAPCLDLAYAAAAHTRLGERRLEHVRHGPRRPCGLGGAAQRHLWPLRAGYAARPCSCFPQNTHVVTLTFLTALS